MLGEGAAAAPRGRRGPAADRGAVVTVLVYLEHADGAVDEPSLQALTLASSSPAARTRTRSWLVDTVAPARSQGRCRWTLHVAVHEPSTRTRRPRSPRRSSSSPGGSAPTAVVGPGTERGERGDGPRRGPARPAARRQLRRRHRRRRRRRHARSVGREPARGGTRPRADAAAHRAAARGRGRARRGEPAGVETFTPALSDAALAAPRVRARGRADGRGLARRREGRRVRRARRRLGGGLRRDRGARRRCSAARSAARAP